MGRVNLGKVPEEIGNEYMAEAEELGLSRVEYTRECIEIGRMIFQSSGKFDVERLRKLTENEDIATVDSDLTTADGELVSVILNNLPTEEHRALTKDELRVSVFGTEDEQMEQITKALKELNRQGKIEPLVDDGYIKIND